MLLRIAEKSVYKNRNFSVLTTFILIVAILNCSPELAMSDDKNEEANKIDLNETNEDGEILTLSDLLNEQREIDEVS